MLVVRCLFRKIREKAEHVDRNKWIASHATFFRRNNRKAELRNLSPQDAIRAARIVLLRPFLVDPEDTVYHAYFAELPILLAFLIIIASYKVKLSRLFA